MAKTNQMESSNQAEGRLTPQEVGLHHARSKALNHGLITLAPSTLNGHGSLQSDNIPLSILQPQAKGLVRTLASVILQRTPRTKNARSGLPQDEQSKEIKNSKRNSQAVTQIKVNHHNGVTNYRQSFKATQHYCASPSPTIGGS